MKKKEQDLLQKLKERMENVEIPESLAPDRIERRLGEKGRKRKFRPFRAGAAAAACFALVLGLMAFGVIRTTETAGTASPEGESGEAVEISDSKTVDMAEDYQEVYEYLEAYQKEIEEAQEQTNGRITLFGDSEADTGVAVEESVETESAAAETGSTSDVNIAADTAADYSETNVRQEGVDEGDMVKTDGTYLYVLQDNSTEISVVDTRGNEMKEATVIELDDSYQIQEIYLQTEEKRLVLVCGKDREENQQGEESYYYGYGDDTAAVTYDITNPEKPEKKGEVVQNGSYQSSRLSEGYLYLFSNYYVDSYNMEKEEPDTYVPLINNTAIAEESICLPQVAKANMYAVATSVNLAEPDEAADSKAMLSEGGELYVSSETIYYYETVWADAAYSSEKTTIRSMAYEDGALSPGAQGSVDGYIHDSFCIDEYEDYLRIVTTEDDTNSVYVLDQNLEIVGEITGLAEEERVYSARFMGDVGYFVTFKETDPLFSVDLSNPKKPAIIGALKIPGFSDYLHPYGDGKLLGIGMDVDEETLITDGVKLTMFDISDPAGVTEEDTYVLKNVYSTDASYDYKAVLADVGKNLIGFPGDAEGARMYYAFEYDADNGFICNMEEEIHGSTMQGTRGVYIGDTLYVVQGNVIESYSLDSYEKVGDIIL